MLWLITCDSKSLVYVAVGSLISCRSSWLDNLLFDILNLTLKMTSTWSMSTKIKNNSQRTQFKAKKRAVRHPYTTLFLTTRFYYLDTAPQKSAFLPLYLTMASKVNENRYKNNTVKWLTWMWIKIAVKLQDSILGLNYRSSYHMEALSEMLYFEI